MALPDDWWTTSLEPDCILCHPEITVPEFKERREQPDKELAREIAAPETDSEPE